MSIPLNNQDLRQRQESIKFKLSKLSNPYTRINDFVKFFLILKRSIRILFNNKAQFLVFNVQMFLIMAIIIGVYYTEGRDYDQIPPAGQDMNEDVRNRIGSMFFIGINYYACFLVNSAFSIDSETSIIYREVSSGIYGPGAYFWARSISDLVLLLPLVTI